MRLTYKSLEMDKDDTQYTSSQNLRCAIDSALVDDFYIIYNEAKKEVA